MSEPYQHPAATGASDRLAPKCDATQSKRANTPAATGTPRHGSLRLATPAVSSCGGTRTPALPMFGGALCRLSYTTGCYHDQSHGAMPPTLTAHCTECNAANANAQNAHAIPAHLQRISPLNDACRIQLRRDSNPHLSTFRWRLCLLSYTTGCYHDQSHGAMPPTLTAHCTECNAANANAQNAHAIPAHLQRISPLNDACRIQLRRDSNPHLSTFRWRLCLLSYTTGCYHDQSHGAMPPTLTAHCTECNAANANAQNAHAIPAHLQRISPLNDECRIQPWEDLNPRPPHFWWGALPN